MDCFAFCQRKHRKNDMSPTKHKAGYAKECREEWELRLVQRQGKCVHCRHRYIHELIMNICAAFGFCLS